MMLMLSLPPLKTLEKIQLLKLVYTFHWTFQDLKLDKTASDLKYNMCKPSSFTSTMVYKYMHTQILIRMPWITIEAVVQISSYPVCSTLVLGKPTLGQSNCSASPMIVNYWYI